MKLLSILCLLTVLFSGCYGWKKFDRDHNPMSVPKDIRDPKYVLLVQKQDGGMANHQNNMVNNQMRKFYKGRYEMVSANEISTNPKYADVSVYRYVIRRSSDPMFSIVSTEFNRAGSRRVDYKDETIHDRQTKADLRSTRVATHNYAQGINLFAKAVSRKY